MQLPHFFGVAVLGIILAAMIVDGHKHGMLNTLRDWAMFACFLASLAALGFVSYMLSVDAHPETRIALAVCLAFGGSLIVKLVLDLATRLAHARHMRQQGFLTEREFNRQVNSAFAAVDRS